MCVFRSAEFVRLLDLGPTARKQGSNSSISIWRMNAGPSRLFVEEQFNADVFKLATNAQPRLHAPWIASATRLALLSDAVKTAYSGSR